MEHRIRFRPGQVWRYRSRPGEEESRITVLQVDGTTVHVHIEGLSEVRRGGAPTTELFVPLSAAALRLSVTEELRPASVDAFESQLQRWIRGYDTRDRGESTVPVAQLLRTLDLPAPASDS